MTTQYNAAERPHGQDDRLLTMEEVAELTRVCVATLRWMRHTGAGPRSFKQGRRVLYKHSDVREWINHNYNSDPRSA